MNGYVCDSSPNHSAMDWTKLKAFAGNKTPQPKAQLTLYQATKF